MSFRPTVFVVLTGLLLAAAAAPARSQDRLPPIPPDKQTEAQKKAAAEFRVEPSSPWRSTWDGRPCRPASYPH